MISTPAISDVCRLYPRNHTNITPPLRTVQPSPVAPAKRRPFQGFCCPLPSAPRYPDLRTWRPRAGALNPKANGNPSPFSRPVRLDGTRPSPRGGVSIPLRCLGRQETRETWFSQPMRTVLCVSDACSHPRVLHVGTRISGPLGRLFVPDGFPSRSTALQLHGTSGRELETSILRATSPR